MTSGHKAVQRDGGGEAKHFNHSTCKYWYTIDTQFALMYKKNRIATSTYV